MSTFLFSERSLLLYPYAVTLYYDLATIKATEIYSIMATTREENTVIVES
jgi:hypothetical protein